MNDTPQSSLKPLQKIALSFSGGGFRAAAFCLGNLSYLNYRTINNDKDKHETLLSHVEFIASVSGGSFANLGYAYYLYSDKTFEEFYTAMVEFMNGTKLLDIVIKILENDKVWKEYPHKSRNLINAFSIAYNNILFDGANLGLLNNENNIKCLREICINSTEFDEGLSFRFQNSDGVTRNGKMGNSKTFLNTNYLHIISKIQLSDIAAASSCFPAGFEPMIFPNDFTHNHLSIEELAKTIYSCADEKISVENKKDLEEVKESGSIEKKLISIKEIDAKGCQNAEKTFALMDGGIDDNQGIQSMLLADNEGRLWGSKKYDTFITCDVSSPFMNPYSQPLENKNSFLGKFGLVFWQRVYFIFFGLLLLFGGLKLFDQDKIISKFNWAEVWITLGGVGLLLGVSILLIINYFLWTLRKKPFGKIVSKYIKYFANIRLRVLSQMIKSRAESTAKITIDIFMKQIRRLSYDIFYSKIELKNRRITNTIYELSAVNYPKTEARTRGKIPYGKPLPVPSKSMMDIAQNASSMGTTLWFDEEDQKLNQMENIIATGQFTMCYNLLTYLYEIEKDIPSAFSNELKNLQSLLLEDWNEFNKNPNFLLESKP